MNPLFVVQLLFKFSMFPVPLLSVYYLRQDFLFSLSPPPTPSYFHRAIIVSPGSILPNLSCPYISPPSPFPPPSPPPPCGSSLHLSRGPGLFHLYTKSRFSSVPAELSPESNILSFPAPEYGPSMAPAQPGMARGHDSRPLVPSRYGTLGNDFL